MAVIIHPVNPNDIKVVKASGKSSGSKKSNSPIAIASRQEAEARKLYQTLLGGRGNDNTYTGTIGRYRKDANASLKAQETALGRQLATSKAGVASNYDSTAAQNYINYMRQRNALPEQLAAQGINGGASESALVRVMNNYALNQGNTSASRNAAMGELQNAYDTNLANLRLQTANDIAAYVRDMNLRQAEFNHQLEQEAYDKWQTELSRKETAQQKKLEQYAATIERFNTIDKCNAALKALKKSDPFYAEKSWLIKQRRAQLAEGTGGSGGGGGGGGGYRRGGYSRSSGGGSSSGGSTLTASQRKTVKNINKDAVNRITNTTNSLLDSIKKSKARQANIRKGAKATNYGTKNKYGKTKTYKKGGLSQR